MTRRKWVVAGCVVAVAGVAAALTYHDQVSWAGHPTLTVHGKRVAVASKPIPADEFDRLPWDSETRLYFGAGRREWDVAFAGSFGRKDHVVPGPLRDEARYFRQELLRLEVPDRRPWGRKSVSVTLIASGHVSPGAKEFFLDVNGLKDTSSPRRLAYEHSGVDEQTGIMTVRIAWAFPLGEPRMCDLRFRLTREGFVFAGQ